MSESEGKSLVFVVLTMLFFFMIISTFPAQIMAPGVQNYDINRPDYYQGLDLGTYAFTANFTLNEATFTTIQFPRRLYYFELGGQFWYMSMTQDRTEIEFGIRNYWGIFLISLDPCGFRAEDGSERGDVLTYQELNQDYTGNEGWIKYRVYLQRDPSIGCDVNFGFDVSTYGAPSNAFTNEALQALIGLGIEDTYTTFNAWQMIGALLFFRAPNIHPVLNGFIAVPLWLLFAYAVIRLILRFIPLLG